MNIFITASTFGLDMLQSSGLWQCLAVNEIFVQEQISEERHCKTAMYDQAQLCDTQS
ncbi:hypothetical protein [Desulfogranum japonicum]|uniref:hypothetical protein n=1 Tax=Desulfogranum japonicum TaxID=231447 RepID=UPI0003F9892C|nr:hypothetical protein [Desulfogranum japonicum]